MFNGFVPRTRTKGLGRVRRQNNVKQLRATARISLYLSLLIGIDILFKKKITLQQLL
jgi:hypothetical protein